MVLEIDCVDPICAGLSKLQDMDPGLSRIYLHLLTKREKTSLINLTGIMSKSSRSSCLDQSKLHDDVGLSVDFRPYGSIRHWPNMLLLD